MIRDRARQPRTVVIAHPGAELYGSDRVMLEAATGLVDAGWRVVVALPTDGPLVGELERVGAEVTLASTAVLRRDALRPAGFLRLVWSSLTGMVTAARLIRRERPEVVYVSTLTIPIWTVLPRLMGARVVAHVQEAERSAPRPLRFAMTAPLVAAHRIVVNSRFTRDVCCEVVPRLAARTDVVLNPIGAPEAARPVRSEVGDRVDLVYVGRLSPRKGVDVALDAVAILRGEGLDARLTVVGSTFAGYEWYERDLRAAAEQPELRGAITFVGFAADVASHLAAADVALVPSRAEESFGNTAVEAILAGRPVVVSATSGLLEATAGYGGAVLVDPNDPAKLADAVRHMVAAWGDVAAAVVADRVIALTRHSPAVYRARVVDIVAGQAGR